MNNHKPETIVNILRQYPSWTYEEAISYLNDCVEDSYDPEGERELIDMLEEREMDSHIEHIRSQGGDYWQNDAGEWCCG